MTTIVLNEVIWSNIYERLADEYQCRPGVLLIRSKMKETLGFTVRRHRNWQVDNGPVGEYDGFGHWQEEIHLDFYDEQQLTLFRLKYL